VSDDERYSPKERMRAYPTSGSVTEISVQESGLPIHREKPV
jgi:hypothetical protein